MDVSRSTFRASAPAATASAQLGPLAELVGTWRGRGFNLISLPDEHNNKPFRVMLTATHETLTVTPIGGPIPNRGSGQDDIFFLGLQYLQQISDAATDESLHVEPGLWLNVPATTAPHNQASVVRMGTVPHGDAVMAEGTSLVVKGGPKIDPADSTPFTLDENTGARINDTNERYLAPFSSTPLPPGIPGEAVANPNVLLTDAIEGQEIVETVVLTVNACPIGGINGTPIRPPSSPHTQGGIVNMPFVVANADANSFSSIFWIETVKNPDGSPFLQLQYTQTVILDFIGVKWPHISVATLVKQ